MTSRKLIASAQENPFSPPAWLTQFNRFGQGLSTEARGLIPLEMDPLFEAASAGTGLNDFGSTDFREPLGVLLQSLENEAAMSPMGRILARGDILNLLENRLYLTEAHRAHPEMRAQGIEKPVFIVGLPRSGTSILHELLAQDPRLRAPLSWEAHSPWPSPGAEPETEENRIQRADEVFTFWNELVPEYKTMHEMGARIPCECIWLTAHSFRSEEFLGRNQVPSYGGWLATADLGPAYRIHRQLLELLQWKQPTPRWLLKAPSHMLALAPLLAEYPDARIIQTHRDPLQIMGSSVNILKALWWMRSEEVDPELIQASFAGEGLAARLFAALDYRDGGENDPGQFRDVRFSDLMEDPIATLNSVYEWHEMDLSPEIEKTMLDYLQAKPRGKHGKHEYTFSELGLDLETERGRFLDYQARFNVPSEIS